jgi:hypothetical protein
MDMLKPKTTYGSVKRAKPLRPKAAAPDPLTRPGKNEPKATPVRHSKTPHPNAQAVAHANSNARFMRAVPKPKASVKRAEATYRGTMQINEPARHERSFKPSSMIANGTGASARQTAPTTRPGKPSSITAPVPAAGRMKQPHLPTKAAGGAMVKGSGMNDMPRSKAVRGASRNG